MKHYVLDTRSNRWVSKNGKAVELPDAETAQRCAEAMTFRFGRAFFARSV